MSTSTIATLKTTLQELLVDYLGQYEILGSNNTVLKTVPAVWINSKPVPANYRVKGGSGLELIIEVNPELNPREQFTNVLWDKRGWTVILVDWASDPTKPLHEASELICAKYPGTRAVMLPAMEITEGKVMAQCRLVISNTVKLR